MYCLLCRKEYRWVALPTSSFKALKCRDSPAPTPALLPPKGLFIPTHFLTSPVPSPASQLQLPLRSLAWAPSLYIVLARQTKGQAATVPHLVGISRIVNSGEELGRGGTPACSFEHVFEKQLRQSEARIHAHCGCEAQQIRNTSHLVLVQGTGYPGATTALLLSGPCQMLTLIKPYQKHNLFLLTKCSCPCRYTDHKEGRLPMASTPDTGLHRRQSPYVWPAFSTLMSFLSRGCAQQDRKRPRGLSSTKTAPPCLSVEDGPTTEEGNYPTYLLNTMHT